MSELANKEETAFVDLVKRRVSCRSYRTDPVPKEMLNQLLEAARLAPSACNRQPWRFAVVTDDVIQHRIVDEASLPGIPMRWTLKAGAIIVLGMSRCPVTHRFATKISGVDYPLLDLGITGEHIVLQAEALGLGTCWIGWFKPKVVRKIVNWPRKFEPVGMIAVGWPASEERKTRPRLLADDITTWI